MLDRLGERLRGRPVDAADEGKKHGAHRWRQGYDIGEIVSEFAHLRTALLRSTVEYARENGWDLNRLESAHEAINEVLDEATAHLDSESEAAVQRALPAGWIESRANC